jgi:hypothetical protein
MVATVEVQSEADPGNAMRVHLLRVKVSATVKVKTFRRCRHATGTAGSLSAEYPFGWFCNSRYRSRAGKL